MARIHHPAIQGPVSLWRSILFRLATWMQNKGRDWEECALYPDRKICPDCGQRMYSDVCDHHPILMAVTMTESHKYTEREILEMRRRLARQWGQSLSQVMDNEARHYLDKARDSHGEEGDGGKDG